MQEKNEKYIISYTEETTFRIMTCGHKGLCNILRCNYKTVRCIFDLQQPGSCKKKTYCTYLHQTSDVKNVYAQKVYILPDTSHIHSSAKSNAKSIIEDANRERAKIIQKTQEYIEIEDRKRYIISQSLKLTEKRITGLKKKRYDLELEVSQIKNSVFKLRQTNSILSREKRQIESRLTLCYQVEDLQKRKELFEKDSLEDRILLCSSIEELTLRKERLQSDVKDLNELKELKSSLDVLREEVGVYKDVDLQRKKTPSTEIDNTSISVFKRVAKPNRDIESEIKSILSPSTQIIWYYESVRCRCEKQICAIQNFSPCVDSVVFERAYNISEPYLVKIGGHKYRVDMSDRLKMVQINMKTKVDRLLKRVIHNTSIDPSVPVSTLQDIALEWFIQNPVHINTLDKKKFNDRIMTFKVQPLDVESNIGSLIQCWFGRSGLTVYKIEQLFTPHLYDTYKAYTRRIKGNMLLIHGTDPKNIMSIAEHGLKPIYSKLGLLGRGLYFTNDAKYCAHPSYTPVDKDGFQKILLCRVATGDSHIATEIEKNIIAPNGKDSVIAKTDGRSITLKGTDIWAVYEREQVIIEAIIYCKTISLKIRPRFPNGVI